MTGESILTSDSGVSSRGKLQERLKELCDRRRNGLAHSDKNTAAASLKVKERRQAKEKAKLDAKKKGVALSKKTGDSAGTQKKTAGGPFKADGKLIFSKFDLGVNERDKKKRNLSILGGGGNSKSSSSIMGKALSMPSDPKQALAKLEARQLKLHKLTQENPEKAHQKGIDLEWKKAVALASGEKIKDDERLLKKSLKKRQAQKAKSSVAWKDRLDKEKIQQKKSIKKRAENIANRKKRPGFEGKAFSSKKSRK